MKLSVSVALLFLFGANVFSPFEIYQGFLEENLYFILLFIVLQRIEAVFLDVGFTCCERAAIDFPILIH